MQCIYIAAPNRSTPRVAYRPLPPSAISRGRAPWSKEKVSTRRPAQGPGVALHETIETGKERVETVGVGGQVDAHNLGLLVDDVVDEAGILVAEPVVVLPPDVAREETVERGDGPAPGDVPGDLQPLRVLLNIESTMWMNAS
jgi:hypothetical protein